MFRRFIVGLVPVAMLACGCNMVGTASLGSGRAAYGEVVTKTNDEQLLRAIVMDRFAETVVLMAVTSVTANVRMSASAGGNIGVGPSSSYERNLVPLSVGVAYEENPTISYVPVETPAYLQQMMSPMSLGEILLMIRGARNKDAAILTLIERMNGLTNPMLSMDDSESSSGFVRAVKIMADLSKQGVADMVSIRDGDYGVIIRVDDIADRKELEELLTLLELTDLLKPWGGIAHGMGGKTKRDAKPAPADKGDDKKSDTGGADQPEKGGLAEAETDVVEEGRRGVLVIPFRFSAAPDGSSIAIMTRSVYDLVQLASLSVDVPEEQIAAGKAPPTPASIAADPPVRILRSTRKPTDALVATKAHDNWYYIDNNDLRSKEFFRLLTGMWSAQMAAAKTGSQAPVLTVGVSR